MGGRTGDLSEFDGSLIYRTSPMIGSKAIEKTLLSNPHLKKIISTTGDLYPLFPPQAHKWHTPMNEEKKQKCCQESWHMVFTPAPGKERLFPL